MSWHERNQEKLEALRNAIRLGLEDVAAGRVTTLKPGDEARFIASLGRSSELTKKPRGVGRGTPDSSSS